MSDMISRMESEKESRAAFLRAVFWALLSGAILALSMPKPGFWPAAWIGLVPLFIAIRNSRPGHAALLGFISGSVYYGIILSWISLFGNLPWALLVIIEAAFFALFALVVSRVHLNNKAGRWGYIVIPATWTTMQWLRTLSTYGFPWGSFAHSQASNLIISQLGSLTGPWGVDFLVCLANISIAETIFPSHRPINNFRRFSPAAGTAILTAAVCMYGLSAINLDRSHNHNLRVAIIQSDLDKRDIGRPNFLSNTFARYGALSIQAARKSSDLIVWPETTLPTIVADPGWGTLTSRLASDIKSNMLIGGYDASAHLTTQESYNSAFLFGQDGRLNGIYHKVQLVPFGEFVPMRKHLPFINEYPVRDQDVLAGKSHTLLNSEFGKIGVSICFESLFPEIAREETRNGAKTLFIMTNDAWFEHSQAAKQHLMMSQLRAIENRRCVVRAAGTGISAIIDSNGRIVHQLGIFRSGIIAGNIGLSTDLTLYTRIGSWLAYICAIITLLSLINSLRTKPEKVDVSPIIRAQSDSSAGNNRNLSVFR